MSGIFQCPPEEEAKWRAEFDEAGESEIRDSIKLINQEPKRQFAFHWLREQAKARQLREEEMRRYAQRTIWAAIAAVIVGVIGVLVTLTGR